MEVEEEVEATDVIDSSERLSLPSIEEVEVRHAKALLEKAGDLPLDVAHTVLASHYRTLRTARSAGVKRLTGGFIQCPSCSTPWMADLCRPRLLGCPRNLRGLKRITKQARKNPGKLTKREKSLLSRYQDRKNVIEVSCLVCRHKKEEIFSLPERREKEVVQEEEEEETEVGRNKKKKKKKKRGKELNAGLLLSSTPSTARNKGVKVETDHRNSPNTPKNFLNTSKNSLDRPKNSLHVPKNTLATHKLTSASPYKPRAARAKVVINTVSSSPSSAPAAVTKALREKRQVVGNLKKAMGRESAKSEVWNGGGKTKNSLSSFLESLL